LAACLEDDISADCMDKIRKFLANDRFARLAGVELLDVGPGRAKASLTVGEKHLNGAGMVHGAAIFVLADFTFAAASNAYGTLAVGINVSISFMKAVKSGVLTAEARETSRNAKLATYDIPVRDETGDLVAGFQGLVYRKKETI